MTSPDAKAVLPTHAERIEASTIYNADGSTEGSDPRTLSIEQFAFLGHVGRPLLKVIQAKCLDCCCHPRWTSARPMAARYGRIAKALTPGELRCPRNGERRSAPECPNFGKSLEKIRDFGADASRGT